MTEHDRLEETGWKQIRPELWLRKVGRVKLFADSNGYWRIAVPGLRTEYDLASSLEEAKTQADLRLGELLGK